MTKVSPTKQTQATTQPSKPGNGAGAVQVPVATTTQPVAPVATSEAQTATGEAPKKRGRKAGAGAGVKRIFHPALEVAEKILEKSGKKVLRPTKQIESVPTDYNAKLHKPLNRRDFVDESVFLEFKAVQLEQKAQAMREQAKDLRTLGGIKDRADAKKLLALQKRMAELTDKLRAGGKVDVDAISQKFAAQLTAKKDVTEGAPAATGQ